MTRAERPTIALRTDAGGAAGLGHLRRSLALASGLALWARPRLLLYGDEHGCQAASRAGADPVGVGADPEETVAVARALGAVALVVDSYAFPPQALAAAGDEFPVVVAVDDTGEFPLPADVVVNAAIGLESPAVAAATRYLLGPAFALLDPSFSVPPERRQGGEVRRVLVTLGGATPAVLMEVVTRATRAALPDAALDVVVGPAGDGSHEVGRIVEGLGATVHRAPESMRILMLAADIAVSAGGVTAYELAATGTPTVGVTVARNQLINVRGLARAGALWSAGDAADPRLPTILQDAVSALAADADARARMGAQARALVDGFGATRVADAIRARLAAGATTAPGRTC